MITVRYHQLVGKTVMTADGQIVGRVADLAAERRGEALAVTELLVGPAALVERIGFRWLARVGGQAPRHVPWTWVAHIDDQLHLSVPLTQLETLTRSPAAPDAEEAG